MDTMDVELRRYIRANTVRALRHTCRYTVEVQVHPRKFTWVDVTCAIRWDPTGVVRGLRDPNRLHDAVRDTVQSDDVSLQKVLQTAREVEFHLQRELPQMGASLVRGGGYLETLASFMRYLHVYAVKEGTFINFWSYRIHVPFGPEHKKVVAAVVAHVAAQADKFRPLLDVQLVVK